jgi:hypothetical protein
VAYLNMELGNNLFIMSQYLTTNRFHPDVFSAECLIYFNFSHLRMRRHAVAWFVEALCYKPEGHGLKSR